MVRLAHPILTNTQLDILCNIRYKGFKSVKLPMLFEVSQGCEGLKTALDRLCMQAEQSVADGVNYIILSDKDVDETHAPIPSLLAVSAVHHHLISAQKRVQTALVVETGEMREVMHAALLLGYGASAINPYMSFAILQDLVDRQEIQLNYEMARKNYIKALCKGLFKVMSKMGISTIRSYRGAKLFEAVGLSTALTDAYFGGTASSVGGIRLQEIAADAIALHHQAFRGTIDSLTLEHKGLYSFRKDGEKHAWNPETISALQQATRLGSYKKFKEYTHLVDKKDTPIFLRDFLTFRTGKSIPIEDVEPISEIMKRFVTGAMSFGSISKEAHETMAVAMNKIHGRSNTGEGGEDSARFTPREDGLSLRSAIKQVASGRFGVTAEYLVNAEEIQIKVAQGAKPGEGGHLPGKKVYPWIAKTRYSTPGVSLISPPPHHDIYSIEDLAQLIYDLKNANPQARISVKLVSEAGVGTIASGVAKAGATVVLISGYDGGTGAASQSSIHHAGLPWELGLAQAHQNLVENGLRSRVLIETDGKLKTGKDVAIACLLGAEEFGFASAPLVTMGCMMMRVCNLDTCPAGIATQNPELRKRFAGKPEYVENFMRFIAEELREYMAKLGVRTVDELVGRSDFLKVRGDLSEREAKLDLSNILNNPFAGTKQKVIFDPKQVYDFELDKTKDITEFLKQLKPALDKKQKRMIDTEVTNVNRSLGTIFGSEITKKYDDTLDEDTFIIKCSGAGGQSFGAFIPKGLTLELVGDSNDYFGKGLSGGKLIVYPPAGVNFKKDENIIIGNVALYGATSGKAFINGVAGERFCVRNSGATAVVEGVGDHGCEYMTGGRVVILGKTGKNFAAGMSGGIAYVLDENSDLYLKLNKELVSSNAVTDKYDVMQLKDMIREHVEATDSERGKEILANFSDCLLYTSDAADD